MVERGRLGEFLRNARLASGRSLADIAREAEIGKSTLSTWERDLRQPCVPELDAVLRALGAPPEARAQALAMIDAPRAARALGAPGRFRPDLMAALRSRAGLSQGDLAQRLGFHGSAVSRWEHGHDEPSASMLRRFTEAVGAEAGEHEALASLSPYGRRMSIDELDDRFSRLAFGALRRKDVEYLLLREALRDAESQEGKRLRMRVAVRYAQHLSESGRQREALTAINAVNDLAAEGGCTPEELAPAVLAEAAMARDPDHALRVLATLGDDVRYDDYVAWIADDRGYHLARAGEFRSAVASARRGVEIALAGGWEIEIYYRQRGAARTYLRAGLFDAAFEAAYYPRPDRVQESSFDHALRVDLFAALGDREKAAFHRSQVAALAAAEGRLLS